MRYYIRDYADAYAITLRHSQFRIPLGGFDALVCTLHISSIVVMSESPKGSRRP